MIYLFNKDRGEFKELPVVKERKKRESLIPVEPYFVGGGMIVNAPIDFYTIRQYKNKSETHLGALNFKIRNIGQKGFTFNNMKDNISAIKKLKIKANANGETLHEVMYQLVWDWVHDGNMFIEVAGVGNNVAFYRVSPDSIYGISNQAGTRLESYKFYNGIRDLTISATKQDGQFFRYIKHIKRPNGSSALFGLPDWYSTAILQSIEINYGLDSWIENFIANNARFDFLIVTEGDELTQAERDTLKAALTANKGYAEKGKGGYFGVGFDTNVKVIELNKVDHSGLLECKSEYIQQIVQAHGISPYSVGVSNGGKSIAGNEAIGALRTDYESYIKPEQNFLADQLNGMFYEVYGVNPELTFMPMDVVSDKEKAVIADTFIKNKVASASYFRRKLFPDMTPEEIKEAEESTLEDTKVNFQEKPDAFDDTQNYERADRR